MRPALLALGFSFLTSSALLVATGGFSTSVYDLRVSAHSPMPAAIAAAVFLAAWLVLAWRNGSAARDLEVTDAWIERHAEVIVLAIATLSGAVAVFFGTFSAAGSDASGYFSEAAMLTARALFRVEPLAAIAGWPDAATTLAPLGWRAAGDAVQVPTYAVGLPLLMALPHALGGPIAASLVVSVSAALVVWFGARLAMAAAGGAAAVLAAVWLATMPIEILESIQPMSDVPVTAAWLACWWYVCRSEAPGFSRGARGALIGGLAAAVAVLIRPNLAPLAAIPALYLWIRSPRLKPGASLLFATPVVIAGGIVAYLQWRWFGSALRSGYGSASEIYSLSNVAPNASLYLRWLLETHGPWLLAAPLALFIARSPLLRWMLAFAVLVCSAYFVYAVFEHWSYLRFLLPALAIAVIAVAVVLATLIRKLPTFAHAPVLVAVAVAIAASNIANARELEVFRYTARQSRALLAGRYLASALPPHAVLLTGEQSGAMRYYTDRSIVRWDLLVPDSLVRVDETLATAGRDLWLVLDDWEVERVREKFRGIDTAGLDWPPAVDAGTSPRLYAWRVRDRARFMRGERMVTDFLR